MKVRKLGLCPEGPGWGSVHRSSWNGSAPSSAATGHESPGRFRAMPAQTSLWVSSVLTQSQLAREATGKLSAEPRVHSFSLLGMKGSPLLHLASVPQNELFIPLLETGTTNDWTILEVQKPRLPLTDEQGG